MIQNGRLWVPIATALGLVLGACGGGASATVGKSASTSTPTTAPSAPPGAFGAIASISGSTIEVQNPSTGQVTVTVTPSTVITELEPATAADVVVGKCVRAVGPPRSTSGLFTAQSVSISQPGPSGCVRASGGLAGAGIPRRASATSGPRPTSSAGSGAGLVGPRSVTDLFGKVVSVAGSSFVVQATAGRGQAASGPATVGTAATTRFTKLATLSPSVLAVGRCVAALGPVDQTGAVTADSLRVLANNPPGGCNSGLRGRGRLGGSSSAPAGGA